MSLHLHFSLRYHSEELIKLFVFDGPKTHPKNGYKKSESDTDTGVAAEANSSLMFLCKAVSPP